MIISDTPLAVSEQLREFEKLGIIAAFSTENRNPDRAGSFRYRLWFPDQAEDRAAVEGLPFTVREAAAFCLGVQMARR